MKINNTAKRISCLLLAVCLLFCGFAHVLHTPAEAVAVTATASVIALAVALFGWLGISFASVDAATKTTEEFVGIHPDALTFLMAHMASAGPGGGGTNPNLPGKAVLGVAITAQLVKFLTDAKNFFNAKGEGTIDVVDPDFGVFDKVKFTYKDTFADAQEAFFYSPYSYKNYLSSSFTYEVPVNSLSFSVNNVPFNYYFVGRSSDEHFVTLFCNENRLCFGQTTNECLTTPHPSNLDKFHHWDDIRFGFRLC